MSKFRVFCFLCLLCGEGGIALPVPFPLTGRILCDPPKQFFQTFMSCWYYPPEESHYDLVTPAHMHEEERGRSRSSSDLFTSPSSYYDDSAKPNNHPEDPQERFNLHFYLDHMWHLNIGFDK